jgi:hypothetical protein
MERECALVQAVDLGSLGRRRSGGKGEVRVAARLGEDLHLVVDPAVAPA